MSRHAIRLAVFCALGAALACATEPTAPRTPMPGPSLDGTAPSDSTACDSTQTGTCRGITINPHV